MMVLNEKMIKMGFVLFLMFFLFWLPMTVLAQEAVYYTKTCIDSDTLLWTKFVTIEVAELNITRTINVTEPQRCNWGCQNNECMSPPWVMWGIIIVIIIAFVIIWYLFFKQGR